VRDRTWHRSSTDSSPGSRAVATVSGRCYGRAPRPEGGVAGEGLALTTIAVVVLLFPPTAAAGGWETTVETFPADFVMDWNQCPNLPQGTTITGTGTGTSITKTKTNRHGVTKVFNSSIARSTATDRDGNRYWFLYSNQFLVSNADAPPGFYTGKMVDVFVLHGHGPAQLTNGFLARITTDLGESFSFDPIFEFGDPINFETGAAICDPL
jgi:hypothetical protein